MNRARLTRRRRHAPARLGRFEVPVQELRWVCPASDLPFKNTGEVRPVRSILGQGRATRALAMGLEMESPGYNVFVCGLPGTGRRTALRHLLARTVTSSRDRLEDLICLPRFSAPDRIHFVRLPRGRARTVKRDVHGLFRHVARIRERMAEETRPAALRKLVNERLPVLADRHGELSRLGAYFRKLGREIIAREGEIYEEDFGVQVLVSRSARDRRPVVWPSHISFTSIFGTFDKQRGDEKHPAGVPVGSIRAGALVEARGGFLVLSASDLLEVPNAWNALKNCLLTGRLHFFDFDGHHLSANSTVDADHLPLDVKVILIGDYSTYDQFLEMDPEFVRAFRIRVDFDVEMPVTRRVIARDYPGIIARIVEEEGLRHLTARAVAKVIEYGVRRAGRKSKISIQFSAIADLIREANFWAGKARRRWITEKEVAQALNESIERLNLLEVKIAEMINDGVILIDTVGSRVGQVNGLAVYDQGDYLFGKPSRITAETSMGHGGIINIERESGLSGRSHDKGIQILGGYLRSRFAQKRPLSLTASVCFEQSYSGVDGDSASATEIYAIISSLSDLPIRQDIAVTGSLNQKGDIQPIGGVNEKIEGFYDCVHAGSEATGREGVIIPRRNVPDLMLREDIVQAVRRGKFTIYAIDTVEEGIEILTGHPAGSRGEEGGFSEGTVFYRVDRRLDEIASGMREFPEQRRGC